MNYSISSNTAIKQSTSQIIKINNQLWLKSPKRNIFGALSGYNFTFTLISKAVAK